MSENQDAQAKAQALEWIVQRLLVRVFLGQPDPNNAAKAFTDDTHRSWADEMDWAMRMRDSRFASGEATDKEIDRILNDVQRAVESAEARRP